MLYTPSPSINNHLLSLYRVDDYLFHDVILKSQHYEFIEINRGGRVFYQYRKVGHIASTWMDSHQRAMISDIAKMTEEEWTKKYTEYKHEDYKLVHDSFQKFKEEKAKQRSGQEKQRGEKWKHIITFRTI